MRTIVLDSIRRVAILLAILVAVPGESRSEQISFSENIARIVYDKCSACHRPGQPGPFDLLTYGDVSKRGNDSSGHRQPLYATVEA